MRPRSVQDLASTALLQTVGHLTPVLVVTATHPPCSRWSLDLTEACGVRGIEVLDHRRKSRQLASERLSAHRQGELEPLFNQGLEVRS
jgi:precorrin-6x reductase